MVNDKSDGYDEAVKAMKSKDWKPEIPEDSKLTEEDLTHLIKCMGPALMSAMFSKSGSTEAATTFKNLSFIRPEIVIPPLLEWTYSALETLTEPHRLTSCLQCVVSVVRSMVSHTHRYPEGPLHAIPLLQLSLPGIDPNDLRKSLMTFQLITTMASLIPIVDCSKAPQHYKDLTKYEVQLCSASADFEGFLLQYFDRVISMIENSVHHHSRTDTVTSDRMSNEEIMLELCLLSSSNSLLQQTSLPIFQEVLKRLQTLALGSFFETRVAGRFTSKLVKAASKARPELVLPKFVPHCCSLLTRRLKSEDLHKDDHLDDEILWNLMLLSEMMSCDGKYIPPQADCLVAVLDLSLNLRCKEAADLSGSLLRNILRAMTSIYATDYRSTVKNWDTSISESLPIREWGKSSDPLNLKMKWHIPSQEEKNFVQQLLTKFLLAQLDKINAHCSGDKSTGQNMAREELCRRLNIIHQCLLGACAILPMWNDGPLHLIESSVALNRFSLICGFDDEGILLRGKNVRLLVAEHMKLLLDYMPIDTEDDTKSLIVIIKIIGALFHSFSPSKDEFDGRWKTRHHIKTFMANKLVGKKKHIRSLLVDRVQLQHELRSTNQSTKYFTTHHRIFYKYLFSLATSRYMQVRKAAQSSLALCFRTYAYSYNMVLDDLLGVLHKKPGLDNHQFKGALYIIFSESKQSLATRRNWILMNKLWPALVLTPHFEKPSVNLIHDSIIDKIHKDIETVEIIIKVTPSCLQLALGLWKTNKSLKCLLEIPSESEMKTAQDSEEFRNEQNLKNYFQLVNNLTDIALKGNLYWRSQQVCFELLSLLIRYDVQMPSSSVKLFVTNLNNSMISIRKISIHSVSALLKQQKRPHPKMFVDPKSANLPYGARAHSLKHAGSLIDIARSRHPIEEFFKADDMASAGTKKRVSNFKFKTRPSSYTDVHHVPPVNNGWLMYWGKDVPNTEEEWNDFVFINKTHIGYYEWPTELVAYLPADGQPKLGRSRSELSECERPIFDAFNDVEFVANFIKYISMEEHKGKEVFHPKYFVFFKGLFRNFDDTVLALFKNHVEDLVSSSNHQNQESNHRCAAEIIAGILRGSKHWTFQKRQDMWKWLIPVLNIVLYSLSVENINDWGTCIATASENQDPRKLAPLFDLLLENPLSEVGGSFGDSSRLYLVQGMLAQQEWRVPELLYKLLNFLTLHLKHLYKNVRDRIGSVLVNIFLFDVCFYTGFAPSPNPQLDSFFELIIPKLMMLTYIGEKEPPRDRLFSDESEILPQISTSDIGKYPRFLSYHKTSAFIASEELQKGLIRFFKTILKGLQGVYTRLFQTDHVDTLKLLSVMAALESYAADAELSKECSLTLAIMSQSILQNNMVLPMLDAIEDVSKMESWHARLAILNFLQRLTFGNLFLLQKPETISRISSMLLTLLMDEQIEVRELAGVTLSGFFQCGYLSVDQTMLDQFKQWSTTKLNRKGQSKRSEVDVTASVRTKPFLASLSSSSPQISGLNVAGHHEDVSILKRHAGVIGLCACVGAAPYDVPSHVPDLLVALSYHLNDPQPIQMTVKRTLGTFKQTHHENWHDHKQKFTDDQLGILTELLVSPNYYA